jgi:mannose-6-phosphate isomerase
VDNGSWADAMLTECIASYPKEILGKVVAERYNNQLPLLTKIIDAHQDLSIQVHPNDEMAQREHNKFGKSEMWYILDAQPGACLYAGFRQQITPEEYREHVANGTITEVLAKHEVHRGDVFYLPAGRVHAICGGIRLAEVQQSSDVTYRIFDYNRPGFDGKPRELHTELAAKAIDYTVYPEYKTEHSADTDVAHKILNTPYFSVKVIEATGTFHRNMLKYDSFIIVMNLKGDCHVRIRSTQDRILLPEGVSCLIPATIADYDLIPTGSSAKVLEAFINNKKSIGKLISDFLHFSK